MFHLVGGYGSVELIRCYLAHISCFLVDPPTSRIDRIFVLATYRVNSRFVPINIDNNIIAICTILKREYNWPRRWRFLEPYCIRIIPHICVAIPQVNIIEVTRHHCGEGEEGGAEEHYLLHFLCVFIVSVRFVVSFVNFHRAYMRGGLSGRKSAALDICLIFPLRRGRLGW